MTELTLFIVPLFCGALLGGAFFTGLRWTTQRAVGSGAPSKWLVLSFPIRAALLLGGFFAVTQGDWRVVPCLIGFLAGRGAVIRATHRSWT
jgi:F1F0 ATPase subunit 2